MLTVDSGQAVVSPAPTIRYQYRGHLNSSVIEANEHGQVISYEEYYPYGSSAYRVSSSSADLSLKRYRFTGKERDNETGLDYFGVRYYAPWLGRWTSGDPGGFVDGLNLYRYVRNNPVNGVDEMGYNTDPPPTCPDPPCGDTTYSLPTVDINAVQDDELKSYSGGLDTSYAPPIWDAYEQSYGITPTASLEAKGGSPYKIGYYFKDTEDYYTDWFVYNTLQRSEVVAMGRFEYVDPDDELEAMHKSDSQTNIVVTIERYYVAVHEDGEYKPKVPRYKVLFSVFTRSDHAFLEGSKSKTNLTAAEFSNLKKISKGYVMDSPFDFGVGKATKATRGARIVMSGFGGGKSGLVTLFKWGTRKSAVMHFKKHVQGYKYRKGREISQSWDRADLKDFGYKNVDEYMNAALDFINNARQNQLSFFSKEGTFFKFDLDSGLLAIAGRDGVIQSFYKPKKGLLYFAEQIQKYGY